MLRSTSEALGAEHQQHYDADEKQPGKPMSNMDAGSALVRHSSRRRVPEPRSLSLASPSMKSGAGASSVVSSSPMDVEAADGASEIAAEIAQPRRAEEQQHDHENDQQLGRLIPNMA